MKTAVSIPDDVFEQAERLANERNISRSQLYAEALRELVRRDESVTEQLNRVHATTQSDLALTSAARRTLRASEW